MVRVRDSMDYNSIVILFTIAIPFLLYYILWKKFYTSDDCKIIANNGIGLMSMVIKFRMGFILINEKD